MDKDEQLIAELRQAVEDGRSVADLFNLITQHSHLTSTHRPRLVIMTALMHAFSLRLNGFKLASAAIDSLNYTPDRGWTESYWDSSELLDAIKAANARNLE